MFSVAEVALNVPLYRNFDYLIEEQGRAVINIGARVSISFGKQTLVGVWST